mgnify:FL=1
MDTAKKIVLFQCQWCLCAPEDQDWVDHHLPENVHLTKVPCTGRLDPLFILNAVQGGADGVMISGCVPEKCHFKEGNLSARRQMDEFSDFLNYVGYDEDRICFTWLDLQDRGRIQKDVAEFSKKVEALGKSHALNTRSVLPQGGAHD